MSATDTDHDAPMTDTDPPDLTPDSTDSNTSVTSFRLLPLIFNFSRGAGPSGSGQYASSSSNGQPSSDQDPPSTAGQKRRRGEPDGTQSDPTDSQPTGQPSPAKRCRSKTSKKSLTAKKKRQGQKDWKIPKGDVLPIVKGLQVWYPACLLCKFDRHRHSALERPPTSSAHFHGPSFAG